MARWKFTLIATLVLAVGVGFALHGCDEKTSADVARVKIAGQSYFLEIAATNEVRMKGLGGRTHIDDDGGMLFVFRAPAVLSFVMRDCPITIDILFLDGSGRVVAAHEMTPEEPRKPGETDQAYDNRLKLWPSRFAAQFAVELKEGSIKKLGVKEGDLVEFDLAGVKAKAQ